MSPAETPLAMIDEREFNDVPSQLTVENLERFLRVIVEEQPMFDPSLGDMRRTSQVDAYIELCGGKRAALMVMRHFRLGPYRGLDEREALANQEEHNREKDALIHEFAAGRNLSSEEIGHG